jgi:hypothetical protein
MKTKKPSARGRQALTAFEQRYWSHADDESPLAPGAATQPRFVNHYGDDQPGTRVQWPTEYADPATPKNPGRGHRSEAVRTFGRVLARLRD